MHLGGKVLVLTVDPAKRLANALGIERFGNVETQVPAEAFAAAGVEPRGELWAAMLDTKQSWDDLIRRHAPDPKTRDAILANPLYQNLMGRFVQSHDYIAMERLYDLHSQRHLRPDRRRHPADPERHRLPRGAGPHGRLLLVAPAALAHRAGPQPGRQLRVEALLHGGRPHPRHAVPPGHRRVLPAVPVRCTTASSSGPRPSSGAPRPAHHLRRGVDARVGAGRGRPSSSSRSCAARKLHLGAVVLNKVLPAWLLDRAGDRPSPAGSRTGPDEVAADGGAGDRRRAEAQVARVLHEVGASFLNFQVVAQREAETRAELARHARRRRRGAVLRQRHLRPRRPRAARRRHLALSRRCDGAYSRGSNGLHSCAGRWPATGGATTMGLFSKKQPTGHRPPGPVLAAGAAAAPFEFGFPTRCPACGGRGYLDHIDPFKRVQYEHCPVVLHEVGARRGRAS